MLQSVLEQSLENIEHIVIDDGSTDGSGPLLDEYRAAHPERRISVIHQPNSGVPAYNPGLDAACGEYVAFLDHDDYLAPDFCELLYRRAVTEDADICKGEHVTLRGPGRGVPSRSNDRIRAMGSRLGFYNFFWSAIYRRQLLEEHHLRFSEQIILGQDTLFQNEALLACRHLALADGAYYYWCVHPQSISEAHGGFGGEKLRSLIEASAQVARNVRRGAGQDIQGLVYVFFRLIGGLLHYAARAQNPHDARRCLLWAGELLGQCPAQCRAQLVHNLRKTLPPLIVQLLRAAAV